jgi:hypothetical protein
MTNQNEASPFGPWSPDIYYQYFYNPFEFAAEAAREARASLEIAFDRLGHGDWPDDKQIAALDEASYFLSLCLNAVHFPKEFLAAWMEGCRLDGLEAQKDKGR